MEDMKREEERQSKAVKRMGEERERIGTDGKEQEDEGKDKNSRKSVGKGKEKK